MNTKESLMSLNRPFSCDFRINRYIVCINALNRYAYSRLKFPLKDVLDFSEIRNILTGNLVFCGMIDD